MGVDTLADIAKEADSELPAVEAAEQLGDLSANCRMKRSALLEVALSSDHEKAATRATEFVAN